MRHLLLPLLLTLATPALVRAQDAAADAAAETPAADEKAMEEAKTALAAYLDATRAAVKSKRWQPVRNATHPRALESVAEAKLRTGRENHPMAPWARVGEIYLTKFEVTGARPSARGSVVISTTEEFYSVEDKGIEEAVPVEYLLIPSGGKWWVADRRRGENQFRDNAVAVGYRGYFEGEFDVPGAKKGGRKK